MRIVRRPAPRPEVVRPAESEILPPSEPLAFRENRAGTSRALRLFLIFGLGLAAIYLFFLALAVTSPSPGVNSAPLVYGLLTGMTAVLAVFGWSITLGRTPRSFRVATDGIVVRERMGGLRRFANSAQLRVRVTARYDRGLLGREATEMVELSVDRRGKKNYLVTAGVFVDTGPADLR